MAYDIAGAFEDIELALIKLYRHTNNDKYLDMARFFLESRGKAANDLADEAEGTFLSLAAVLILLRELLPSKAIIHVKYTITASTRQ